MAYPQYSSIQYKPLLLRHEDLSILFTFHLGLKRRFMEPGIKHSLLLNGIESLHTMLLQRLHQDGLRHLQSFVETLEFRSSAILPGQRLRGHRRQCTIQVINALDQICGEARDRKLACGLNFPFCALLKVSEFCYGAEISVLIEVANGKPVSQSINQKGFVEEAFSGRTEGGELSNR